jgi:hypothetical protein
MMIRELPRESTEFVHIPQTSESRKDPSVFSLQTNFPAFTGFGENVSAAV